MQTTIVAGGIPAGLMPGAAAEGDAAAIEGVDFAALLMAQIQGQGDAGLALSLAVTENKEDLTLPMDSVAQDTKAEIPPDLFAQLIVDPLTRGVAPAADFSLTDGDGVTQDVKQQEMPAELVLDQAQLGASPVVALPLQPHVVPADPVNAGYRPSVPLPSAVELVEGGRAISLPPLDADTVAVDEKQAVAFSGVMGGQSRHNFSLPVQIKAAEIAVDGKSLPSDLGVKVVDAGVRPLPPEVLHPSGVVPGDTPAATLKSSPPDVFRLPDAMPSSIPVMSPSHQMPVVVDNRSGTTVAVQVPVGNAGWDDALGQKVVWMAGQQQQVAELHLNPPHLGPMEVRLSVSNDQVSALFVSHQPAVREAIEAAMPRLREILADSGMMLGNATVSSDSLPRQQQSSGGEGQSGMISRPDVAFPDNIPAPLAQGVLSVHHDGRGVVDLFA